MPKELFFFLLFFLISSPLLMYLKENNELITLNYGLNYITTSVSTTANTLCIVKQVSDLKTRRNLKNKPSQFLLTNLTRLSPYVLLLRPGREFAIIPCLTAIWHGR